ncbi:ABC transporter ATP-binding protein [Bauldia sp.]|uniref:ABC transporter ATP-binding protein n=1 Tax=Bauldia sp. TaxID=2575872 RepID=UPI003BA9FA41
MSVLSIENLSVEFSVGDGGFLAVDGVTLSVEPGEIMGIVGESGCGKSTAGLAIMGLLPSAGRVVGGRINVVGTDVVPLSRTQLDKLRGREMAMIFQDSLAALDPTMKIGRQLTEAILVHEKFGREEAREKAAALLQHVGIPSPHARLDSYPHEFSGGMRQRVMIAMAIACSPKLLIADEPTTALDVTIQRQVLELILALRDEIGAGVVLITHDVGVVAETCDKVAVMYAGRVVEAGPTRAVLTDPRHPYTAGLLASSLDLEHDRTRTLEAIPGLPPSLAFLPKGCAFAPRCAKRTARCDTRPSLEPIGDNHTAACWNMVDEEVQ